MRLRWPRLLTPTQLAQLILSQKNPLKALDMFKEAKIRYPSYRHNGPVYATMIKILGNSGRVIEMKEIINQMKEDSCECQDSLIASVIKTYANGGMYDEAISLFNSLPEFNCVNFTESFNTLLEIMVKESKLETSYRSDLALHIFHEMEYQWCYPGRDTYKILMKGLCEEGRLTEATHLLYSMFWRISQKGCGADISVYRTLLESLCDDNQIEEAVRLLEKVLLKGLKTPQKFLKQLDFRRFQHTDEQDISYVKALINETLIKGGVPSSDGYKAMAIDLYSEGKILEGNKVFEEMIKRGFRPSWPIYEAKVSALFSLGKVDEAVHVVEKEVIENNCVPIVKFHNIVIKELGNMKESDWAIRYFEKMCRQISCVPNKYTYVYLVDRLCLDGRYVEASRMLEKMLICLHWPGDDMYTKVIKGLCSIGKTYKAVMLLEEMISKLKSLRYPYGIL